MAALVRLRFAGWERRPLVGGQRNFGAQPLRNFWACWRRCRGEMVLMAARPGGARRGWAR